MIATNRANFSDCTNKALSRSFTTDISLIPLVSEGPRIRGKRRGGRYGKGEVREGDEEGGILYKGKCS